ncbi:MAG: homoserine dehydrogenase [Firmicutes bacterium]|nr:homoserine dehydrogenase [Bacillota bacterium]
MDAVKIGLLGLGNVGSGVWKILNDNADEIARKVGARLEIARVLVHDPDKGRKVSVPRGLLTTDPGIVIDDPDIPIIVETIGCPGQDAELARDYMLSALRAGKHVITANKEVLAKHGRELRGAVTDGGGLYYEGAVAGGIPVVKVFKEALAGNRMLSIMGIINGTTNYILSRMSQEGLGFEEVLRMAQSLGYAEQDPTSDVDGHDAAYKLALLASIAFGHDVQVEDVFREGISRIKLEDLCYASELGYAVKLLAIARRDDGGVELAVHPTMIPQAHPLASVGGAFNAVFIQGDAVGDLMLYGMGAGMMPTGSAVVADCIDAAHNLIRKVSPPREVRFNHVRVKPMDETQSRYYVRVLVVDRPGVIAAIASEFGRAEVSIESLIQKGRGQDPVSVVFVTHRARERDMQDALRQIRALDVVHSIASVIRVEAE